MSGFAAVIGHGTPMQIAWWQMCIRAVFVFIFGVIVLRIAGRRAFGRQSARESALAHAQFPGNFVFKPPTVR